MKNWVFPKPLRAAAAVGRAIWAKLRGYELLADEDAVDERSEQCDYCVEHLPSGQCRLCSCLVSAKVRLNTESCPRRKWSAIWRKKQKAGLTKTDETSTS